MTPDELARQQIRLFVAIRTRNVALAAMVRDIHAYTHDAIRFGMRYQDAVCWDESGRTTADLATLSLIKPKGPRDSRQQEPCPASIRPQTTQRRIPWTRSTQAM